MSIEEEWDPGQEPVGDDPNHRRLMAWRVGEHAIQYNHGSIGGTSPHNFHMYHITPDGKFGDRVAGMGLSNSGRIEFIETHPDLRRQGLATKLHAVVADLATEIPGIPTPKHSDSRTPSGDAWARSVDPNAPANTRPVSDWDYRHSLDWVRNRSTAMHALKSHVNEFHAKMMENGLGDEDMARARDIVDSIHYHLDAANKLPEEHKDFTHHMERAHSEIDELGDIHEDNYGNMDDHERLQEHISRMY